VVRRWWAVTLVIGRQLESVTILVVANSDQAFSVDWTDASNAGIDVTNMTISITATTPEITWVATCAGNVSTWSLTSTQTAISPGIYTGMMRVAEGIVTLTAFKVRLLIQ
jgi:hypothetical protein